MQSLPACALPAQDCRQGGTRTRLKSVLRRVLDSALPDDIHERCTGRAHLAVTRLWPEFTPQTVGEGAGGGGGSSFRDRGWFSVMVVLRNTEFRFLVLRNTECRCLGVLVLVLVLFGLVLTFASASPLRCGS